jgi:hypothetical protein
MKIIPVIAWMFLLLFLSLAGCEPLAPPEDDSRLSHFAEYGPAKIDIMPLTEFTTTKFTPQGNETSPKIKVYVSILDNFNCQIKTPAVFRFEIYGKVPRSTEPKGRRIFIWQDFDLRDAAKNNNHWRDFLRAYEFILPFEPTPGKTYILQATALCSDGSRLSADFTLK